MAGPPGVLFAKQSFLHRQSARQDLSFKFYVVVLFVEGRPVAWTVPKCPSLALSQRFNSPLRARARLLVIALRGVQLTCRSCQAIPHNFSVINAEMATPSFGLGSSSRGVALGGLLGSDWYFNHLHDSPHPHIVPTPPFVHPPPVCRASTATAVHPKALACRFPRGAGKVEHVI